MSVQLKAAFLLIIFFINMIKGYAWVLDIGVEVNAIHRTAAYEGTRNHNKTGKHRKSIRLKNSCCDKHVIKFLHVHKCFPARFAGLKAIFVTTLISSFLSIDVLHASIPPATIKYFVQGHHPPIRDIRIAIRSLQV